MTPRFDGIFSAVRGYYVSRLAEHGPEARGVDWSTPESQRLRFDKLLSVVHGEARFSLNDWGCGYGALFDHLRDAGLDVAYTGYDISEEMVIAARQRHREEPDVCAFVSNESALVPADFTVASGVFNVKLGASDEEWTEYMASTLDRIAAVSTRGFAFNVLSLYSDAEKRRPDLHYASPAYWFDYCKRNHSRFVTLLHDYPLWEFTMIVRR